ncbi:hypothetical protein LOZ58_005413 [Ophidiomyces ophidiicola]|nr:hypothetical protein LOZ58_005413 [Ophidiomyces ophidiicola]
MQSSDERSRLRTDPSLSFELLYTTFSETAISCSESDTDEVSRAAKRRRIERLARDYLDGKPLFILTARLQGPFDRGWVNPWNKAKRYKTLETLDSNARQTDIHQKTPLAVTHESGAQTNRSRNELTEKSGISTFRRQRSRNEVAERPSSSFISNNSKNTVVSGEWLKRNGKFWDRRLLDCARSPSPSPINRSNSISLASQQSSLLNEGSYLEGERSVFNPGEKLTTKPLLPQGPLIQSSKSSNTQLCQPLKHTKKKKKKLRNRRQLIRTESPYNISAPSPESYSRSHGGTPSLNRKTSLTPPAAARSFQGHHIYDAIEASKGTLLTEDPAQGSSKSIHILEEQAGTPSKKKPIKLRLNTSFKNTSYGPNDRHNRSSATTTITNFPSAQIVPGQTTFHNQISLHSTQFPVSHNTRFSPAVDGAESTQISVCAVQQQFQEQRPNNPSTADILCSHYHDNASNDVHAAQDSGCIQDISDNPISNTPCTVGSVQFPPEFISESNHISEATVMEIGSRKSSAEVVPPKDIMDCRRSSSTLAEYDALQSSSPVENSPRKSLGTDLALTLAASTATTKHQDGQGFIGFDNFDLDQAIADAGSFLQSWELYADISFQTTRTIPS